MDNLYFRETKFRNGFKEIFGKEYKSSITASFVKYTGRVFLVLISFALAVVIALTMTINAFCNGNSPSAKKVFVTTILENGQLKFLASVFLSPEEIQEVVNNNSMEDFNEEVDTSLITVEAISNKTSDTMGQASNNTLVVQTITKTESKEEKDIEVVEIAGRTFFATMLIVKDPSKVSLATIYPWKDRGLTLDKLVKNNDAIAGTNAGLYESSENSGGRPCGVVVSNGEILMNEPQGYAGLVLIGLTEENILVIQDVSKMSSTESETYIKDNKIRDAVCFQEEKSDKNNHFVQLIINGEQREMNGMGSGLNPRTAIGQRADGTLLFLVTDGRGSSGHLGASASDLINIMAEYDAVNAANLDGGSSSCMYYEDEYLMNSVTFYYSNSSWYLPFAWIIK